MAKKYQLNISDKYVIDDDYDDCEFKEIIINNINTNYFVNRSGVIIKIKKDGKKYTMKPYQKKSGYMVVTLHVLKNEYKIYVHRIVALAFIDNPFYRDEINHIDGDKTNNNVDNLEWCTHKENMDHAVKHGLIMKSTKSKLCKHTKKDIERVCKLIESNKYQLMEISDITGISRPLISDIKNKLIYTDISKKYDFTKYNLKAKKKNKDKYYSRNHYKSYNDEILIKICKMLENGYTMKEISKKKQGYVFHL